MSDDAARRYLQQKVGEFALIARYFAPLAEKAEGAANLTDDVATLRVPPGQELVVTTDALVAGVHFFEDDLPDLIARKALRVNLSDLAAKGATPVGYLLALSLPRDWREDWVAVFARGLAQDQDIFSVSLLGGDTTSTPGPLTLAITALGTVPEGRAVRRSGAKPGDAVFVTGTIGDAGGGLAIRQGEGAALAPSHRDGLGARYLLPEPRVAFGPSLLGFAHASLDVSDGLVADLGHIADASGVRIAIDAASIPLSAALRALWGSEATLRAVTSGDDYEIALTAPAAHEPALAAAAKVAGVALTRIGRVEKGEGVVFLDVQGEDIPLTHAGFVHF